MHKKKINNKTIIQGKIYIFFLLNPDIVLLGVLKECFLKQFLFSFVKSFHRQSFIWGLGNSSLFNG